MFGVKCRNCGYDNLPGMKFCGQCGSQLGQVCEACGFVNPSEHRFCGQCGAALIRLGLGAEHDARLRQAALTVPPVVVPHVSGVTPIELEGERRPVTVVLADVVGSTNILERLGTEAWVRMMNRVLQALEGVVYRFGGVVDQFRGDGLVAFFGAQAAYEDDPERGVLAALGMHGAIEIYAAELIEKEGIDLHLRVGVNTGQVIVASIGDDRHHSEDTAMGEAIAVAARLEAAAKPGTVLVSENTFHLLESQFDWEPLGSITLRGISDPVPIFRPLAPQAGATRARRLQAQELSALLIGREVEFDELKAELEDLRAGRGGILILTGETGMGKSSLIASLRQHAMRDDALLAKADGIEPPLGALLPGALTWLQGRCRSYAQSSPYSMWVDLLQNWLTVHEGQSQAEMRDRLRHQLETVQDDQVTEQIQDLVAFLSPFLALQLGDELLRSAEQLDAEGRREKIFLAVRNLLKLMTRQGPLVLAFEEAHWADTTSLGLLEYCLSLCDHRPLLCLIVVRPDSTSAAWEFCQRVKVELPHRLKCLTLSALSEAQASKMVDRLIGSEVLPAETSALLLERAEGNPYYIEEFIHALIQKGVLVQDEETGGWQATRAVDSLDLPSSLQNLLWARIDRLSAEQRQVLQMAAVIGPVFWSNVLQTLVGDGAASEAWRRGPAALKDHLAALQRAQLIQEHAHKPNLGTEYVFDSNLVRDAAYEGLLSVQRVTCHRQVADALEQIFGEKILARYYSLLAYHYRQASAMRKELFYTLLAAGEAREIYANVEALKHYERALYLLNELEARTSEESQLYAIRTQRFEVLNGRREVYYLMGDYTAGWADAEALLPLAQQLEDDPIWLIDALLQQPGVGYIRGKQDAAAGVPLAEEALALAQEVGDRRREMYSLAAIASQRYFLSDPSWQAIGKRALELARELGDKRTEAHILINVGSVSAVSDPERSKEYLETALPLVQAMDDKMAELNLLDVIGIQLESSGDYCRRLKECHEKQLEISREIGHRPAEARALMLCGQTQSLYLGDYEAGLALLKESQRIWEGSAGELSPLLRIAQVRVAQGRHNEARSTLERAKGVGEQYMDRMGRVELTLVSTILYTALGDVTHLRKALELTSQILGTSIESPQLSQQYEMVALCEATAAHLGLARVLVEEAERQHHRREALQSSQAALERYETCGFVRPIECVSEQILYQHSLALRANGWEAEAGELLQRAYDEMMGKHNLIPAESPYRQTYLENIRLHRDIRTATFSSK